MKRIILASNSPRRRQLLSGLDYEFTVDTEIDFEELALPGTPAAEVPMQMSLGKSHGFHRPLEDDEVLLTADTVVILDGRAIGKPHSPLEAFDMLRSLSGRTHEVITAVTLRDSAHEESFADSTLVTFGQMTDSEIHYYIEHYKPFDKAGAYGAQDWIGYGFITRIEGSYFNVMGLPVHRVREALERFLQH